MDKLLEDFLIYVDTSNSGSEHTRESYYRDIHRFLEYLNSELSRQTEPPAATACFRKPFTSASTAANL